jgi:hypothetical protein
MRKTFVFSALCLLFFTSGAQNQKLLDHLLQADQAVHNCQERLPAAEKAFTPIAKTNFKEVREVILDVLAKIDYAQSAADAAFEESRSAARSAKKTGCSAVQEKALLARDHFKQARFELGEARDQVLQLEMYWLKVKEEAIERARVLGADPDIMMENDWNQLSLGLYINTAELALLNTYPELETGLLAIEEAQLALCE